VEGLSQYVLGLHFGGPAPRRALARATCARRRRGRASINFFPFLADGSKGVAAGLNNVQFLADGEPLGGGGSAAADFATEMEAEDIL